MTFSQHIRSLSLDELLAIAETVQKETDRRNAFIDRLPDLSLSRLGLTINARDLVYRIVNSRRVGTSARTNGELTIRTLFALLRKEDWLYIEYLNSRAFLEIKEALIRHNAPLEEYYGVLDAKADKSLNRRLAQMLDLGK
ncbi:hypothetical protein [Spirosoma koreense]